MAVAESTPVPLLVSSAAGEAFLLLSDSQKF
jgi:hypothetical protein